MLKTERSSTIATHTTNSTIDSTKISAKLTVGTEQTKSHSQETQIHTRQNGRILRRHAASIGSVSTAAAIAMIDRH